MKNLNERIGFGRGLKKECAGEAVRRASRLYSGNAKLAEVWVGKSAAADVGSGVEDSGPWTAASARAVDTMTVT